MIRKVLPVFLSTVILLSGCAGGNANKAASGPDSVTEPADSFSDDDSGQPIALTEEYWEARLGPGYYRIGTDIPLGVLDIRAVAGSGHVSSSDGTLDIDMKASEYGPESMTEGALLAKEVMAYYNDDGFGDLDSVDTLTDSEMQEILQSAAVTGETDYYPGVGFMKGVILTVTGSVKLYIISDNCDVSGMKKRTLIGDPIELGDGEYTAGTDFDEGTYVITATGGIGSVSKSDGSMYAYMGSPAEEGINSEKLMNLTLKSGEILTVRDVTVSMQKVSD